MAEKITLELTKKERAVLHGMVSKELDKYGNGNIWWVKLDKRGELLKSLFLKTRRIKEGG